MDKLRLYSKHQVPEYWNVDPRKLTVEQYIYRRFVFEAEADSEREEERCRVPIPGFSCLLSQIFRHFGK